MTIKLPRNNFINKDHFKLSRLKLVALLLTFLFILSKTFGQTYSIAFGDTINRMDKNGKKQGFWVEKIEDNIWAGKYINSLKDGGWAKYDLLGTWTGGYVYKNGMKSVYFRKSTPRIQRMMAKSRYIPNEEYNIENDTNLYFRFYLQNQSIFSKSSKVAVNSFLDSVNIHVTEIESSQIGSGFNELQQNGKNYFPPLKSTIEYIGDGKDTSRKTKRIYHSCILKANKQYLIIFSKEKFLTKSIIIDTRLHLDPDFKLSLIRQFINLSNRVIDLHDPIILGYPTQKYFINDFANIMEDGSYRGTGNIILERKSDLDMKMKIVELENSVNEQIINLKEKQLTLENERKLKEEELKRIESDNKRKELELSLLAKEKSLSAIILKSKEAELIKNQALANEKKKEIENLNQQKIINELNIKNKETELIQKNIEAETKQKQIQGLEHEKELSNENLKQQKFIQNLILAGSGLLTVFLVFVFFSLSKTRKANKLISLQQIETEKQKNLVEEKNREITDSIEYALRIQTAILPPQKIIKQYLENSSLVSH